LKGFSKEIDHLSLVDFFALQNFSKRKSPMYSQMNCLIENEYIREKTEKTGKKSWRTLLRGGFIIVNRELAYFIAGGFINAM